MLQTITGIGIAFDALICIYFGIRLTSDYRSNKTNLFLKYFVGFFWTYALFIIASAFYIPNLIFAQSSPYLSLTFGFGFFCLYLVSAYAARIAFLVTWPHLNDKFVYWGTIVAGFVAGSFLILNPNPLEIVNGSYVIKVNPIAMSLVGTIPVIAFLFASLVFFYQGLKNQQNRLKFYLLGVSFLLWVGGGALHSASFNMIVSILADLMVAVGSVSAFVALQKRTE